MIYSRYLNILILGGLLAIAGCATSGRHVEPYRDVACFGRAKIALAEAIAAAEQSIGQMVVDAEYNCAEEMSCLSGIPGRYDITLYSDGRLSRATVCSETGRVGPPFQRSGLGGLLAMDFLFDWPQSEMLRGAPLIASAGTSMHDAIAAAERQGGKAMAAHLRNLDEQTDYAIEIVDQGQIRMVLVNPADGTVRQ